MTNDVDVAIAGAGPTGLLLAGDLARAGVSCAVLERRAERSGLTRAFAVHARTLEELDARGVADQLVAADAYIAWAADAEPAGRPTAWQHAVDQVTPLADVAEIRNALTRWCGVPVRTAGQIGPR